MWSETYRAPLIQVANAIGANPEDLRALIAFESSWNPKAYNRSGAVGLIQFMPQTLKDMGYLPGALSAKVPAYGQGAVPESIKQEVRNWFTATYPDATAQLLGPVLSYFLSGKPYPTLQSLSMKVFYPAYRNVTPDTLFPVSVRNANPGIDTVGDYVAHVKKKSNLRTGLPPWLSRVFRLLRLPSAGISPKEREGNTKIT